MDRIEYENREKGLALMLIYDIKRKWVIWYKILSDKKSKLISFSQDLVWEYIISTFY